MVVRGAPLGGLTTTVVELGRVKRVEGAVSAGAVTQHEPLISPAQHAVPLVRTSVMDADVVVSRVGDEGGVEVEPPVIHGPVISPPVQIGIDDDEALMGEASHVEVPLDVGTDALGPEVPNVPFTMVDMEEGKVANPVLGKEAPVVPISAVEFAGKGTDVPVEGATPVLNGTVIETVPAVGPDVEFKGKGGRVIELFRPDGLANPVPVADGTLVTVSSAKVVVLPESVEASEEENGVNAAEELAVSVRLRVPVGATTSVEFDTENKVAVSVVSGEAEAVTPDVESGAVDPPSDVEFAPVGSGRDTETPDGLPAGKPEECSAVDVTEAFKELQAEAAEPGADVGPLMVVAFESEKGGRLKVPDVVLAEALVPLTEAALGLVVVVEGV